MRKILLSLGANKGGEFLSFIKSKQYDPSFEIFAFEPEPRCFRHIEEVKTKVPNITHIKKGVATYDGEATFRVGKLTVSGTLDTTGKKPDLLTGDEVTIEVLDISKWIMENTTKNDHIVMTVDIEGAEYDILEKMIDDGSITYIDKLYLEFHSKKLIGFDKQREKNIKNKLSEMSINVWYGYIEGNERNAKRDNPGSDGIFYNFL